MGLIQDVQALNDTNKELSVEYMKTRKELEKNQKEVERLEKKLQQQNEKKQQQREYERDLKKAVEKDLRNTFEKCFDREGLEKGYINLSLKTTRDEILKNIPKNEFEGNYINDNYERILNKVKTIYKNDQKAKQTLLKAELLKQQKEQQTQNKKIRIYTKLVSIFFIIVNPITIIIFLLILGYFKIALPILNN